MRQRTIRTRDARRETMKGEPMAEGVIPLKKNGQRDWVSLSDDEIVQYAIIYIQKNGITARNELRSANASLDHILQRRNLLANKFKKNQRDWSLMNDEQVILFAQSFMNEKGITGRGELKRADGGLYFVLGKRGLFHKIRFEQKRRDWSEIPDDQIIKYTQSFMKEKGITGRGELAKTDGGLYAVLLQRSLLNKIGYESQKRNWFSKSNDEIVQHTIIFMEENGIIEKMELKRKDPGLYGILSKRGLLYKIKSRYKRRKWESDAQLIRFARSVMESNGINGRSDLAEFDSGLYGTLKRRKLLDQIDFEEKYREPRDWKIMSNDRLVKFAEAFIKERVISRKRELKVIDNGLYECLRRRNLLTRAFAGMEKSKQQSLEAQLLSGLRQAPEAMEKFGEGK